MYSGLTFEKQDSVSGGLSEILQIFPVKHHENLSMDFSFNVLYQLKLVHITLRFGK